MNEHSEVTFALTHDALEPVVARLLGHPNVTIENFSIRALKPGVGNPTSLGVYRVNGDARHGDSGVEPFSLVVKHLGSGAPFMDTSQLTHWNHWRREIEFFESPLAQRIPESIGFPKYLGQTWLEDGTCLFWNGDLGDLTKSQWSWEQCLHAAELVAELNSIEFDDADDYQWLNRTQLDGWLEFREEYFVPMESKVIELAMQRPDSAAALELYREFLPQQVRINEIIRGRRQCFVHGDFNLNNLVPVVNGDVSIIALDWQLCGVNSVGGEVAAIFNTARELGVITGTREEFEQICATYTNRFNELNPNDPVEIDEVRLAVAATGYFILCGVAFFLMHPDPNVTDEENLNKVQYFVDDFTKGQLPIYASVMHELL